MIFVGDEYERIVGGLDRKVVKVAMGAKREATCSRLVWRRKKKIRRRNENLLIISTFLIIHVWLLLSIQSYFLDIF